MDYHWHATSCAAERKLCCLVRLPQRVVGDDGKHENKCHDIDDARFRDELI